MSTGTFVCSVSKPIKVPLAVKLVRLATRWAPPRAWIYLLITSSGEGPLALGGISTSFGSSTGALYCTTRLGTTLGRRSPRCLVGKAFPFVDAFRNMAIDAVQAQGCGKHTHRVHELIHGNTFENLDVLE